MLYNKENSKTMEIIRGQNGTPVLVAKNKNNSFDSVTGLQAGKTAHAQHISRVV